MTLADLANLGQFASSIFVGLQVHQNTKATRATALQMNADYWLTCCTLLADRRFGDVYSKGASSRDARTGSACDVEARPAHLRPRIRDVPRRADRGLGRTRASSTQSRWRAFVGPSVADASAGNVPRAESPRPLSGVG